MNNDPNVEWLFFTTSIELNLGGLLRISLYALLLIVDKLLTDAKLFHQIHILLIQYLIKYY